MIYKLIDVLEIGYMIFLIGIGAFIIGIYIGIKIATNKAIEYSSLPILLIDRNTGKCYCIKCRHGLSEHCMQDVCNEW